MDYEYLKKNIIEFSKLFDNFLEIRNIDDIYVVPILSEVLCAYLSQHNTDEILNVLKFIEKSIEENRKLLEKKNAQQS